MVAIGLLLFAGALAAMARALVWIARRSSIASMPSRPEIAAASTSFATALVVSVALLFVPVYAGTRQSKSFPSTRGVISNSVGVRRTLLQVNGGRILLPLAVPVFTAVLPLLFRRSRGRAVLEASAATLLGAFTVIGPFPSGCSICRAQGQCWSRPFLRVGHTLLPNPCMHRTRNRWLKLSRRPPGLRCSLGF